MTIRIPLPRWLHRLWARLWGFYWLPCPVCGRMYGGHETNAFGHSIKIADGTWRMTCPLCPVEYRPMGDGWAVKSPRKIPLNLIRDPDAPDYSNGEVGDYA